MIPVTVTFIDVWTTHDFRVATDCIDYEDYMTGMTETMASGMDVKLYWQSQGGRCIT